MFAYQTTGIGVVDPDMLSVEPLDDGRKERQLVLGRGECSS